jgi:predicted lipoprotein with Yx(FWY)xxD motif
MFEISRKNVLAVSGLLMVFALVLAACAPAAPAVPTAVSVPAMPTAASAPATSQGAYAPAEAVVPVTGAGVILNTAKDVKLGTFLVDGKGMTLYLFTKDTPGKSNCTGDCLVKWPPLVATDVNQVKVGPGIDGTKLGLADLPDGKKIVTYKGMSLYYWYKDMKPGDTTGQNVGNVWFVVAP